MDINPEDKTLYTTQFPEEFLKHVEIVYCAKHRCVLVIIPASIPSNNLFTSAKASGSSESSIDPYEYSSDDEKNLPRENVAEVTPSPRNYVAR